MKFSIRRLPIYFVLLAVPILCYSQVHPKPFKLALAQMNVVGGDRSANLNHAGEMIREAAENGAQVVLLPEAMDLGWTDPSALTDAEPVRRKNRRLLIKNGIKI